MNRWPHSGNNFWLYHVTNDRTGQRRIWRDIVDSEEVGGHQDGTDHIAQDDLAVGVAKLGDGDVDDEGDGEAHQADDAEPGEHQGEGVVAVSADVATLLLHCEHRITFQHQELRSGLSYVDTVFQRLLVTFIRKFG